MSEAEQEEHKTEIVTNDSGVVHVGGGNVSIHNVFDVVQARLTPAKKFKSLADQMAWDAYKRIERRYRDANRRLAK